MSDEHLFGGISGLSQSEAEIRHIFNRYVSTLFSTKWKISDEITDWSKKLINQIQDHVTQQKDLLEQVYTNKVSLLNTMRDKVLEHLVIYEQKKDTEKINKLLNQCNTLKVELAMLMYVERPIVSIQLITEEQLTQQNQDECNVHKTEDEQSPKQLIKDHDNDIINNTNTNETSSSKLPSINTESTNSSSSVTKSTNDEDQSIENNDKLENNISNHDGLAEKCPICFMIFAQTMTAHDRNIHVNEHYRDD